jgi:hypothetical protein
MSLEPVGAGTFADTGTYSKIGAVSTLKIVSGTQTIDAVRMTVIEHTYGVVFSFTVSKLIYDELGWQAVAALYAAKVESVGSFVGTQGIEYLPQVTPGKELTDALIVTVGTPDGLVAIDVEIPLATADSAASAALYVDAYNTAIAGLVTL